MGYTELPEEIILGFIEENSYRFTSETYDLLSHNCNNFSEEFVNFLTGNHIPDKILNLPTVLLSLFLFISDSSQHSARSLLSSTPRANGRNASDSSLTVLLIRANAPTLATLSIISTPSAFSALSILSVCDGFASLASYARSQASFAYSPRRHA